MIKPIKFSIICLLIINIFSVSILTVSAADPTQTPLLPPPTGTRPDGCPSGTTNCGNYQLNDFMQIALIVSEFILGLVGALALLAFIVGGLMWLLSAGNAELVNRGKQAIVGAVIGLAIVFTSFMIIQLVYSALGIEKATKNSAWSVFTGKKSDWFK